MPSLPRKYTAAVQPEQQILLMYIYSSFWPLYIVVQSVNNVQDRSSAITKGAMFVATFRGPTVNGEDQLRQVSFQG